MTQKNQPSKASLAGKLSALTLAIGAMSPLLSACSHGQDNGKAPAPKMQQAPKAAPSNPCAPQAQAAPTNPCAPQAQAAPSNPCAPQTAAPASTTKAPSNPCAPAQSGSSQG